MNSKAITSITFILIGNMLTTYGSIGEGWSATFTSIFGYVLFFIGLIRLKNFLDVKGRSGVSKIISAVILGIIANIFSYIPLIGFIPEAIIRFIAFIVQLVGLLQLRNSTTIGKKGASGVDFLLIAIILIIFANILGVLPFAGDFIEKVISLLAFLIIPFGWLKIQQSLIESSSTVLSHYEKSSTKATQSIEPNVTNPISQKIIDPYESHPKLEINNYRGLSGQEKKVVDYFLKYGMKNGQTLVINKVSRKIEKFDEKEWSKILRDFKQNEWIIISGM